jgi:hypothetical protein
MKKLIVLSGLYGHIELAETDVVQDGKYKGLSQREMFERIMREGYGKGVPAIFHTEFLNGEVVQFKGSEAAPIIDRPDVEACWVIAPICGGLA